MRGVWGPQRSNDSLTRRLDQAGLDGAICAEYITSLQQLYSDPSDRAAAIHEFLDSSASALTPRAHARFVSGTVEWLGVTTSLPKAPPPAVPSPAGGFWGSAPDAPAVAQPTSVVAPPTVGANKKGFGFKNGVKLTGSALKQVIGSGRPSYVQKYSDDEETTVLSRPAPRPVVARQMVPELSDFPATPDDTFYTANSSVRVTPVLEQPGEWVKAAGRNKKNKIVSKTAPEKPVSPIKVKPPTVQTPQAVLSPPPPPLVAAEEPSEKPIEPNVPPTDPHTENPIAPTVTSAAPNPTKQKEAPRKNLSVSTGAAVNIESRILSLDNMSFINSFLPADLMSIDFQFEEDEKEDVLEPPIGLFKAMFAPPAILAPHPGQALLDVLMEMKLADPNFNDTVPLELRSLHQSSPKITQGFW